ncbi:MAG: Uma2 family endonuclease [Caldilineaceae bacterium]
MTVQSLRRRFTVDDYHKMIDAGILCEDDRVELLDGEIHDMSPIDSIHAANVNRLNRLLTRYLDDQAIVSVQNPLLLNDYSEPQPDLLLLRWRDDFYEEHHPTPADTLLVIEVANTSVTSDRTAKLPRYAAAGVPEVWIVNIKQRVIEQYTQPDGDEYGNRKIVRRGVIITTCVTPALELPLERIFGQQHHE